MVPEEFDLSDNADDILAVVLSQELERYNELLETMKDSLQNALNGLAGACLLSEEMEEFIEQIKEDEIPKVWQYGLWSFQTGDTKLERFLPKNQHTQRK